MRLSILLQYISFFDGVFSIVCFKDDVKGRQVEKSRGVPLPEP